MTIRHLPGLFLLLAAACGLAAPAPARTHRAERDRLADAIQTHAGDTRLLLLGEQHGTREIPPLVAELVRRYAARGPVTLALEIPRSEQPRLDAALDATSARRARAALLAGPWWHAHRTQHDGRRSEEMLGLIDALRRLRAHGRAVRVLAYDTAPDRIEVDADQRDREMAKRLREAFIADDARLLVLGGNVHAMLERPADAPPQMPRPAGSYLRDLQPVSVRLEARSGQAWLCLPAGCAAHSIAPRTLRSGDADGPHTYYAMFERFSVAHLLRGR